MNKINTRKALNPAYRKHKPLRKEVTHFINELQNCINAVKLSDDNGESEEHIKSHFTSFFSNTFYQKNYINTKDRIDLAIYLDDKPSSDIAVLIEAKKPSNKAEFLKPDNLNKKALQELLLYYLRERLDNKNNNIKHLIATNGYEWYLFKSEDFYNSFYKNKALIKEYESFRDGLKDTTKNELFYNEIAKKYIGEVAESLPFVHLDFASTNFAKLQDKDLNTLYKIFSDVHLLGHSFGNDSNQLNKAFYNELLHIIGLEEVKDKGKKIINRKTEKDRDYASLLENTIFHIEDRDYLAQIKSIPHGEDKSFNAGLELCLTWVNRILFLKLLESQLLSYHQQDEKYKFLNDRFINGFDDLNDLFFSALAKKEDERHPKYKDKYKDIPYLNSSLFERNTLEDEAFEISALNDDELEIYTGTVLKDANGKKQKGKLPTLKYLFLFLDAYDFATDGAEGIEDSQETKSLINASVLGLIFEKINGYKEGSFYTPAYITMYMCRETIRRTVVQKFAAQEEATIETFEDLQAYCSRLYKAEDLKRLNAIVNSVKICDPAVGSGHFLVSALNELIVIKNELRILIDAKGNALRCDIEIVNDELYIIDDKGLLFEYKPTDKESIRVQHTLFHEKQTLIENCLFGVDINPNSVKICRLRLWIELLKNAYYTPENRLQTLPNIDINIKTGNSLISRFQLEDDLKDAFKNKELNYTFKDYKNAVAEYKDTNSKARKKEVLQIINEVKNNFKSTLDNGFLTKYQKAQGALVNEQERQKNLINFGEKIKKAEKDALKKLKAKAEKALAEKEEIVNNAIYENAFEWRFEFPEVLNDEGTYIGFDAVIGNPPYLQMQSIKEVSKIYKTLGYATFESTGDLYALFYEKGIRLLAEKGTLIYITSNKWLRANYGKSLRKFFTENNPLILIDLGKDVFETASVDSNILQVQKNKNQQNLNAITVTRTTDLSQLKITDFICLQNLSEDSWIILNQQEQNIKNKIEDNGTPLKEWGINIYRGILTGYNNAFIIDGKIKNELIEEDNKSIEILKPILRGRNINRYNSVYEDLWLINSHNGLKSKNIKPVDINEYPAIKKHLDKHWDKISVRGDKGITPYNLRNCAYLDEFDKEKIVWASVGLNEYCYVSTKHLLLDTNYFAVGLNKYHLAILNSKLIIKKFIEEVDIKIGSVAFRHYKYNFEKIPIPKLSKEEQKPFIEIANKILSLKQENPEADTTHLEKEIDEMVYELYGLSAEEIEIVENS